MKTILTRTFLVCLLVFTAILAGCKPEIKDIGPSYVAGDGIYGTWSLSRVTQTDLSIPLPETRDLSALIADPAAKTIIRFNTEKTYEITQQGSFPRLFGVNGTWSYDVTPYPTKLILISSSGDTLSTNLSNMPREIDQNFGFNFDRINPCGKAYVNYAYTFSRN